MRVCDKGLDEAHDADLHGIYDVGALERARVAVQPLVELLQLHNVGHELI